MMVVDAYLATLGALLALASVLVLVALVATVVRRIVASTPALRIRARRSRRGAWASVSQGVGSVLGGW